MDRKSKALNRLLQANQELDQLFKSLENHNERWLTQRPMEHKWSVLEILNHLYQSERLSLAYVKKKLSFNTDLPAINIFSMIRFWVLKTYLIMPVKFKAPLAVDAHNLESIMSFKVIKSEWMVERKAFVDYFESLDDQYFHLQVYKHPLAGRISLLHMVSFFSLHLNRHKKQINSIIKQL